MELWVAFIAAGAAIVGGATTQLGTLLVESRRDARLRERSVTQQRLQFGPALIEKIVTWRLDGRAQFRIGDELDREEIFRHLRDFQVASAPMRAGLLAVCSDSLEYWLNVKLEAEEDYLEDVIRGDATALEADRRFSHFLCFLDVLSLQIRADVRTYAGGRPTFGEDFPFFD
jgi:hypothetical protein